MIRKTGDSYYENGNFGFQNDMQPQPQVKTSSSEFQVIFIHYDKGSYNKELQNAYPLRRRYSISKDETI